MDNVDINKAKGGLFNAIAPIYGKFYNYQVKNYRSALREAQKQLDLSSYNEVLDIGCGTGALCFALKESGFEVTGVDEAEAMIRQSKKNNTLNINFSVGDVLKGLDFNDKSFDIVISSYVAHGLKKEERVKLYKEAARLAKHKVIFHDYNKKRRLITDIAEWLEGGDYFYFIHNAEEEMKNSFKSVNVINVSETAAWYVCEV